MNKISIQTTRPMELDAEVKTENKLVGSVQDRVTISTDIIASGPAGINGLSAFELWLGQGNEGTVEDYLASLRGADGEAATTYIHDQIVAAAEWTIQHDLGKYPAVSIVDTAGSVVMGSVEYISNNILTVYFTTGFSGKAYLN